MTRRKTKPAAGAVRPTADGASGAVPVLPEGLALRARAAPIAALPSARVPARLPARIRAERPMAPAPAAAVPAGGRFEPARASESWRETLPGGRFKMPAVDDPRDVVLLLAEMAPGARFADPPRDVSAAEGAVTSGEGDLGGRLTLPGNSHRAESGREQADVTSPSGCTALRCVRAPAWRQWQGSLPPR